MRYDLMSRLLPRSRTRACHESLCHRDWHIISDRFELQPECHRDGSAAAPILFPGRRSRCDRRALSVFFITAGPGGG